MLIEYRATDKAKFSIEVETVKQAFQFIAYADSIFSIDVCGQCGSPNLRFLHRTPQEYNYYSLQCKDCKYELKFGETKEGNKLYPKGWEEPFDGGGSQEESQQEEEPAQEEKKPPAKKPAAKKADGIAF